MINVSDTYPRKEPQRRPLRNSPPPPESRLASLRGILGRNKELLRNASSLAATTGVTSVLGFAYWIYAARVFPQEAVGYATAAISTMTLLGTIGMFGLGTMLIGELPLGGNRGGLITASLIASFVGSLTLGVGFALVTLAFGGHFAEISGTIVRMAVFSFGVATTAATLVFDEATIGLMRGGLQLSRNVAVSVIKMAALPATALVLHDLFGLGIMLSWVIGTNTSLIPVAVTIKRGGGKLLYRPDWATFWRLGKVTLSHNWLNLTITVPAKLVPVLVAIVVDPKANAAFYVATMMSSFLYMVPQSLSTVLFAIASAAPKVMAEKLRFVLRLSLAIGVPAGLVLGISGHFMLSIFGSNYAALAAGPLWISIAGYIPGLPSAVYIAVCRATGRVNQAAIFLSVFACLQMGALVIGGKLGGLYGLSYAMLGVGLVEACITTPTVLRAAFGKAIVVEAGVPVGESEARLRVAAAVDEVQSRQEAGLAALIALATTVAPSRPSRARPVRPQAETSSDLWQPAGLPQAADTRGRQGRPTARATSANPAVRDTTWWRITGANPAVTDTTWWPDFSEAAFETRQEVGMAALMAMATHAARF
jgi:O-antigen/teichoic acid export membrane protein